MNKNKSSLILALLAVSASSLTACGKKKGDISFWSAFGQTYGIATQQIVDMVEDKLNIKIDHTALGGYDNCKKEMVIGFSNDKYPNIAMGYPDHFALYLGDDGLTALDSYLEQTIVNDKGETVKLKDDYYEEYMPENLFTSHGESHYYGVPFNKSTEVLGYNGTFVSYCESLEDYKQYNLGDIPVSWQGWAEKGPIYREIYDNLCDSKKMLYGIQEVDGSSHDFELAPRGTADSDGNYKLGNKIGLLDFTDRNKATTRLISYDSTDNAFITLIRQWGAEYTKLSEEQTKNYSVNRQKGDLCFASSTNMPKVIECLKFFNNLNKQRIFGIPSELEGSYSSDAFAVNDVMFMICSSGGLSYNTKTWHSRFRVLPIPYYDDGTDVSGMSPEEAKQHVRKSVISQGANICMTDLGNFDVSFNAMKELTTGDIQIEWCLKTGYYPCSKSAGESKRYNDFINEGTDEGINEYIKNNPGVTFEQRKAEVYSVPSRVAFREGSDVNQNEYMIPERGWDKFVDPAFKYSSSIRTAVAGVFKSVFANIDLDNIDNSNLYKNIINNVLASDDIQNHLSNINIVE